MTLQQKVNTSFFTRLLHLSVCVTFLHFKRLGEEMHTLHNTDREELYPRVGQHTLGQCDSEETHGAFPFGVSFFCCCFFLPPMTHCPDCKSYPYCEVGVRSGASPVFTSVPELPAYLCVSACLHVPTFKAEMTIVPASGHSWTGFGEADVHLQCYVAIVPCSPHLLWSRQGTGGGGQVGLYCAW